MGLWLSEPKQTYARGFASISEPAVTETVFANQYYNIDSIKWEAGEDILRRFELNVNGQLKYIGSKELIFLLNGVSDVKVSAACELHYGLFKNGGGTPLGETPHTFPAQARVSTISIVAFIRLTPNEYVHVKVKTDNAGTDVTSQTLTLTLISG